MPDLGSDAAGQALDISKKSLEILLKLIENIFKAVHDRPVQKAAKYDAKVKKTAFDKINANEKLDSRIGKVSHDLLKKSGELTACRVYLKKEELKDFADLCRRERVPFAAVTDAWRKKHGEEAYLLVECRAKDLERIKAVCDRLADERRMKAIDERMEDIIGKGRDNVTEQDLADLKDLQRQKEDIQREGCDSLNKEMRDNVEDSVLDGKELKPMKLGEALDRKTGRALDKDVHTIIADAADPSKVIRCHGYNDKDSNGRTYIRTDYEVYHGEEHLLHADDGRFAGRPAGYWDEQKASIEKAADFSGVYYKFYTQAEYERWAEHVNEQNRSEFVGMDAPADRKNYSQIIGNLEGQLEKGGGELREDGIVYGVKTGKPMTEFENAADLSPKMRTLAAENVLIGEQIKLYRELKGLRTEKTLAEAELKIKEEGSPEYRETEKKLEGIEDRVTAASAKEAELIAARKNINAAQAQDQMEEDREEGRFREESYYDDMMAGFGQEKQQQEEQASKDTEHPDGRRGDRVDETDEKQASMEEYKSRIQKERKEDGAKQADVKDRQVHQERKTENHSDR